MGEQWTAAELDVRQRLSEKTRNSDEAHGALRQQLAELDSERNSEIAARREQVDHQQELLSEGRARVMSEMEAQVVERRLEIQGRVDEEVARYSKLRGQQLRRIDALSREVDETKSNVAKLRDNYRSQQVTQLPALKSDLNLSSLLPAMHSPCSDLSSYRD